MPSMHDKLKRSKKKQRSFSADDLNINTGSNRTRKLRDDNTRAKTTDDLDGINSDIDIADLRGDGKADSNNVIADAQSNYSTAPSVRRSWHQVLLYQDFF